MATYFANYHGWLSDAREMEDQSTFVSTSVGDSLESYLAPKAHLQDGIHAGGFSLLCKVKDAGRQP
ncbi:hypothetical protein [Dryocola sp. BD586]|uniref:hypothetical protein n=1 Tax=Dryocola sp. BD586 TaxID=3133271 RepID=UPI003F4FEC7D